LLGLILLSTPVWAQNSVAIHIVDIQAATAVHARLRAKGKLVS
jgi:hypothetical protein